MPKALQFALDPAMARVLGLASWTEECENAETLRVPSMAWICEELRRRDFDLDKWPPLRAFVECERNERDHLVIGVVVRDYQEGELPSLRLSEQYHVAMPSELYWPRWRNQWVDLQFYNVENRVWAKEWLVRCYRRDGSPVSPDNDDASPAAEHARYELEHNL